MINIAKNLPDLKDKVIAVSIHCNSKDYPTQYQTYDEAWQGLFQSFDNLKDKLGEERYEQVVDMTKQAKTHYEAEEIHWASWLMQDIGQVLRGEPSFAYPEEMYRWPKVRLVK